MKGYVTVCVAFAAVVVMVLGEDHTIVPIPDRCPLEDSLNYTVHVKHESDCTKFYKCFRGQPIEMSCPKMNKRGDKLHFNALLQVCDYPNRAGCIGTPTPVIDEPTTPPPWNSTWTCENAGNDVKIPHETRCYLFYRCVDHIPRLERCAEGLHFDPHNQVCNKPSDSDCPVKDVCRDYKSKEGKYLPDPNSCKHVYYCKDTTTARYACDEGAEWSVEAGKCLLKEKANCLRRFDY